MNRDFDADVNGNLRDAFVRLAELDPGGAARRFGPVTAAASGILSPMFNRIFAFDSPPGDELAAAVEWMVGRDVPFWVTMTASAADAFDAAADLDLVRTDSGEPGMVLPSLAEVPAPDSTADITTVADRATLDDVAAVAAATFEMPHDVARRTYPDVLLDADDFDVLLGRVDGEPVACGLSIRTDDVAGVYSICVREGFRRRGIGEAMTRAVLHAGRDAGCRVGALQSSEMGYPVYERMGFETVVDYAHFEPTA